MLLDAEESCPLTVGDWLLLGAELNQVLLPLWETGCCWVLRRVNLSTNTPRQFTKHDKHPISTLTSQLLPLERLERKKAKVSTNDSNCEVVPLTAVLTSLSRIQ